MRQRSIVAILVALMLWASAGAVCAQDNAPAEDAAEITARMQEKYEALTGFSADIVQRLTNAANGSTQTRTGALAFKNPSLVRWQTATPEEELLVVGQDAVWDYFPEEGTAYRYTVEQVLGSKTMLRFLSGKARLDEEFYVTPQGREDGYIKLELIPHTPESNLVQAYLWLTPEGFLLRRVVIVDFFGNENDVTLTKLHLNPDFPDGHFTFTPPEDVEIVENSKP